MRARSEHLQRYKSRHETNTWRDLGYFCLRKDWKAQGKDKWQNIDGGIDFLLVFVVGGCAVEFSSCPPNVRIEMGGMESCNWRGVWFVC